MIPDFADFLRTTGDLAYLAGLGLMAVLSWAAGRQLLPGERLPMQWDLKGRATWRADARFGLMFSPVLAGGCGLLMTVLAHHDVIAGSAEALHLAGVRTLMALAFVIAHLLHLGVALAHVRRERRP